MIDNLIKITSLTCNLLPICYGMVDLRKNPIKCRMRMTLCHDIWRPIKMVPLRKVLQFNTKMFCLLQAITLTFLHLQYLIYTHLETKQYSLRDPLISKIFWLLCCLPFFDLWILIIPLVSSKLFLYDLTFFLPGQIIVFLLLVYKTLLVWLYLLSSWPDNILPSLSL